MDSLRDFEEDLEARIGRPTKQRPFICNGSPLSCNVFIVGYNPATTMNEEFWDFWRDGYGFDKSGWLKAYHSSRLDNGKRAISNTRRVMNWIGESAASANILETNLYWVPSKRKSHLKPIDRDLENFRFLSASLNPQIIILHGIDAHKNWDDSVSSSTVIREKHFAIGYSEQRARELGKRIDGIISN